MTARPTRSLPLIAERIGDAEIVVMNKTPISRETIDKCPNIKLIAVLATGYNVVDYNYAREKGIPVVNVPTYGTASVSQFSIALLLEICHHIGHHSESVHAGNWRTTPTGATGTIPLSNWRARRSVSSALASSGRRRGASPRRSA